MRFLKESPRKTIILGLYLLLFVFAFFIGLKTYVLLLAVLVLTLILIAVFFIDCVAMLGNIYYGRGEPEKAAKFLKYSIAHNTKSPAAHLNYSIYLLRRGGAKEASALLDKAVGLNPKTMTLKNLYLTKASCLWVLGDIDGAVERLERMRKTFDYVNAHVLSTLAYMYFLKGDIEQAEALSQAAIADTPATSAAWDNIGQIRYTQQEWAPAKEAFLKALEYKADLPDSMYYLGLIAQQEGDRTSAENYFTQALDCKITPLNTVTREQIEAAKAGLGAPEATL